ncbi:biopolymer transporter ExbD [Desulfobacter hydrogenophilus]|uniref:Biopolymer transporter ExbD n=1 Tax=Desulfobacter hydrogenophilus TaxID=2291 RepID=A0A328F9Y4_9BACT|nr:biopolymer transporter ExbD [Desulfobacter hydrogenophilus]NDY74498.1 biopolymer transporter ExbD [Desulfobacter hydrogenophilus]QBH15169.1 biopolymer transporter ExbD [Desulfobacter hydrogenophilus]RAL99944.1 biopolymer transporter ExbD [Desulfobacter hydrogenophilus]
MINVRGSLRMRNKEMGINMSPLIDLVFLLLIFFMVTTSFVRETGIDVQRPSASSAALTENGNILVAVSPEGSIHFDGRQIDIRSLRSHITRALSENPEGAVVIVADKISYTGKVIQVMDQCRLAGAKQVSIAASKDNGGA